jgi:hypothetical protein
LERLRAKQIVPEFRGCLVHCVLTPRLGGEKITEATREHAKEMLGLG